MDSYEATFEIDSKTDAYAARTMLERAYNTIREESQTAQEGSEEARELLEQLQELRDASKDHRPGTLTITYERAEGEFES